MQRGIAEMEEEDAGRAIEEQAESGASSPHKRSKLAAHHEHAEGEAPIIRREASCPASPPLALPRKLCKRFSTPHGCPFGNSCRFIHLPGSEHSFSRIVNKPKACTKFISAQGCPYGERCHFFHCLPKGAPAVIDSDLGALPSTSNTDRCLASPKAIGKGEDYKSRLCNWFGSANGCRYGEKCHFAHGEEELHRFEGGITRDMHVPSPGSSEFVKGTHVDGVERQGNQEKKTSLDAYDPVPARLIRQPTRTQAASFGRSTKSMISIDANLAGPIIGTSGMHTKHIHRLTGARVFIREHESDQNLRVVEVEGSFEQVKQASVMVKEMLFHVLRRPPVFYAHNYKSKVCEKFPQGSCRFGNRCRFVHVATQETHKPSSTEA